MRYGTGDRHGSDPALLWLWHRPGAVSPIRPLAWEPAYAMGAALKRQKTKKKLKGWDGEESLASEERGPGLREVLRLIHLKSAFIEVEHPCEERGHRKSYGP